MLAFWAIIFWWEVSVISISCLLVRSARRSLSACPQFLVVDFGGMGTVWDDGCVLWGMEKMTELHYQ